MRYLIAAVMVLTTLGAASAQDLQPRPIAPVPGAPGTPTPTPYPQVAPSSIPKAGDSRSGSPLLPPMPLPNPPKDQPLPGLTPAPDVDKPTQD